MFCLFYFFCKAETEKPEHTCQKYLDECISLRCPYGVEAYVDETLCNRCRCYNPCDGKECDANSLCAIDLNNNKTSESDKNFIAVCRQSLFATLF